MLSDSPFIISCGFLWKYTHYLWTIKEEHLSVEKIVIDIVMIGCGLTACLLTGVVANIFVRRVDEHMYLVKFNSI